MRRNSRPFSFITFTNLHSEGQIETYSVNKGRGKRAALIQSLRLPLWLAHAGQEQEKLNQSVAHSPTPYCFNWHCDHSSYTRAAALRQGEGEGTQGRLLAPLQPTAKEPDDGRVCAS